MLSVSACANAAFALVKANVVRECVAYLSLLSGALH